MKIYVDLNREFIKNKKLNIIIGMPCCEASKDAFRLMNRKGIKFECGCWNNNTVLKKQIQKLYEHNTCPMIFLDGDFVGGYRELKNKIGKVAQKSSNDTEKEKGGEPDFEEIKTKAVDLKDQAQPHIKKIAKKAGEVCETISEKAEPMVKSVKEKSEPYVEKAHEKSKSLMEKAGKKMNEVMNKPVDSNEGKKMNEVVNEPDKPGDQKEKAPDSEKMLNHTQKMGKKIEEPTKDNLET
ncbi:Glutaredoxin [Pseudoloma neurophilia]|uniref:Glutaredoxin n=1 Tax=Pseudoloma neurophilia TaxID=146866 RepID=A0A0R0M7G7_9MICR|nr:Glutaredoxin [Pseudoloma neurophilia]